MKQRDIKKCGICDKGMMHSAITFYTLRVQYMAIDVGAVQRQDALETLCGGSPAIAQALGPNEDLAVPLGDPDDVWICLDCSISHGLAQLHEAIQNAKQRKADARATEQAQGMENAGEHGES
jgi:hypothetical protein